MIILLLFVSLSLYIYMFELFLEIMRFTVKFLIVKILNEFYPFIKK